MHSKNETFNKFLDRFSLATAVFVESAVLAICFVVVSPGFLEAIAMAILGVVVVLFSVRAWLKGGAIGKITWALFVFVGVFFDLSFVMISTDSVKLGTGEKDTELVRLEDELTRATTDYTTAQARYDAALERGNSKSVLDDIKLTVDATKASKDAAAEARKARWQALESGKATSRVPLTADGLSTAIYDSATSGKPGRITFLVAFFCLFLGMQLTVVTAATGTKTSVIKTDVVNVENAGRFVKIAWSNYRIGRSPNILKLASFQNISRGAFSDDEYYALVTLCQENDLIDQQGKILADEKTALAALMQKEV